MLSDFIIALRQLRRTPVQTAIAIFILSLGIGLSATMGSLLNGLVLNPFNYPQPERIVQVWNTVGWPLSLPDYQDLRDQSTCFDSFGAYTAERYNIGGTNPAALSGSTCTSGVLQSLGTKPRFGRWLLPQDEIAGAPAVAVISDATWKRVFGSNPSIIGHRASINGRETEIVGVMPPDFEFMVGWFNNPARSEKCAIWTPLIIPADAYRWHHNWLGLGRLKEGISVAAANTEIQTIGTRLMKMYPDSNPKEKTFLVRSLHDEMSSGIRGFSGVVSGTGTLSWILFGAGAFVLLLACTNVSCMMIAQGTGRQREFSVRLALGASRWSIVRLLLCESAILAALASLVGILAAWWGTVALISIAPIPAGCEAAMGLNWGLLVFVVMLVFLCTLITGLPTAFAARDTDAADVLRSGGRSQTGTRGRQRLLRSLIIGQVAVALLLANTAAIFAGSYRNVLDANGGMNTTQVLAGSLMLRDKAYATVEAREHFAEQLVSRVREVAGVTDVALTSKLPITGGSNNTAYVGGAGERRKLQAEITSSTSGYFRAAGLGILRGRTFIPGFDDVKARHIVINRAFAEQAWPDENPVGKQVYFSDKATPESTHIVVGVTEDVRQHGPENNVMPEVYFPYGKDAPTTVYLVVRSSQDARPLAKLLQSEIGALDPNLALGAVTTWRDILGKATAQRRFISIIMSVFVVCAIGLTMVGIYGTLSYYVAERTKEIGVRVALGATQSNVILIILKRAGLWLVIGLVIGIGAVFALARIFNAMLFGMQSVSPVVLIASALLVLIAGLVASISPTLKATKIQPLEALRAD